MYKIEKPSYHKTLALIYMKATVIFIKAFFP